MPTKKSENLTILHKLNKVFSQLMKFLLLFIPPLAIYLFYLTQKFRANMSRLGAVLNPATDFYFIVIATTLILCVRVLISRIIRDPLHLKIESLYDSSVWEAKKRKIVHSVVSLIWYTGMNLVGLYLAWGSDAFPKSFLSIGNGKGENLLQNWPYARNIPLMKPYFIIQFGNQFYKMINHVLIHYEDKEYVELYFTHLSAMIIITATYFIGFEPITVVLLIIHDWGDWCFNLGKVWRDIYPMYSPELLYPFGFFFFSFVRCVMQPIYLIFPLYPVLRNPSRMQTDHRFDGQLEDLKFIALICYVFLVILWLMNCFWALILFKIGYNIIVHNSFDNDIHGEGLINFKLKKRRASQNAMVVTNPKPADN